MGQGYNEMSIYIYSLGCNYTKFKYTSLPMYVYIFSIIFFTLGGNDIKRLWTVDGRGSRGNAPDGDEFS